LFEEISWGRLDRVYKKWEETGKHPAAGKPKNGKYENWNHDPRSGVGLILAFEDGLHRLWSRNLTQHVAKNISGGSFPFFEQPIRRTQRGGGDDPGCNLHREAFGLKLMQ
jgi:hypothetical protein